MRKEGILLIIVLFISFTIAGECDDSIDNDGDGLIDWQYDLGCYGSEDTTEDGKTGVLENGWHVYEPHPNTTIYYISSSTGNDSFDGLYPEPVNTTSGPKKTRTGALIEIKANQGNPDWILFKRGDSWIINTHDYLRTEGISHEYPVIVASYGNSTKRPLINLSAGFFTMHGGSGTYDYSSHYIFKGIHLYGYKKDPSHPEFDCITRGGFSWNKGGEDVIYEDMVFEYFGPTLQGANKTTGLFTMRRNIFTKSYSVSSHAQALFTHQYTPILLEENLFYSGGKNDEFRLCLYEPNNSTAVWKGVSNGALNITLYNQTYVITGLDFSSISKMDDVANIIENGLNSVQPFQARFWWTEGQIFALDIDSLPSSSRYKVRTYTGSGTDIGGINYLNLSKQGNPEGTIFNRNMYLSYGYGNTITRGNIDVRGASGGIQQRMGGLSENNLFIQDPHAVTMGHPQNPNNTNYSGIIRNNVVMDAMNIDTQPQGSGIGAGSHNPSYHGGTVLAKNVEVYNNIIAHANKGTMNIKGLFFGGTGKMENVNIHDNIVYNWSWKNRSMTDWRAIAVRLDTIPESTVKFYNNILQQVSKGYLIHSDNNASGVELYNNTYYSTSQDPGSWSEGWFNVRGSISTTEWFNRTGEKNYTIKLVNFPDPSRTIGNYDSSIGGRGDLDSFIEEAHKQSRFNWRSEYMANSVNEYIRAGFGKTNLVCGDSICSAGETCGGCESDCGVCPIPDPEPVLPPNCGDGNCDSGESCSSCETDCGVCSNNNGGSSSGGGSSGGGGSTLTTPTNPITNSLTGSQKFFLRNKIYKFETRNRFIKRIDLKMAKDGDFGSIELKEKPSPSISISKGKALQAFEITPTLGLSEETVIDSGVITFSVPEQWLEENLIDKIEGIKLARLKESWEYFDSIFISQEDESITYKAQVPGFSEFVIIGLTKRELMINEKNQKIISMAGLSIALIIVGSGIAIIIIFLQIDAIRRRKKKAIEQVKKSQELVRTYVGRIGN